MNLFELDSKLREFAPSPDRDGDGRSRLIGTIAQLLKAGKKVDFFVPGIRGHVSGIGGQGDSVTLKRWNKPYSRINYSLPLDSSDDNRFALKMIKPDYYQVVEKSALNESSEHNETVEAIKQFLPFVKKELGLTTLPKIKLLTDPETTSFGTFDRDNEQIHIVIAGRHPNDVLRTLAHELTHYKQHLADELDDSSGDTGSDAENEANATAGVVMRNYNQQNPENLE